MLAASRVSKSVQVPLNGIETAMVITNFDHSAIESPETREDKCEIWTHLAVSINRGSFLWVSLQESPLVLGSILCP